MARCFRALLHDVSAKSGTHLSLAPCLPLPRAAGQQASAPQLQRGRFLHAVAEGGTPPATAAILASSMLLAFALPGPLRSLRRRASGRLLQRRGAATVAVRAGGVGSKTHVLACCTEYRQETAILQRSAARNGFRFHAVGVGQPWGGFATKFLSYEAALRRLVGSGKIRPDEVVILTDAWDTVVLGNAAELHQKLASLPQDAILCGSERVCGPNHFLVGQIEALYPDGRTPWRYPNSGGLVGTASAMLELLDGLIRDTEDGCSLPAEENDQVRLHDFLITKAARGNRFPLHLDVECQVFQCMYEEQPQWDAVLAEGRAPRIANRLTGAQPIIAHGNGHTGRWFLASLYGELNLLAHLGLTQEELSHLRFEGPVAPGTPVTEEVKAEYCPWWYMPGMHKGATDGFATFRMIREMQCGNRGGGSFG